VEGLTEPWAAAFSLAWEAMLAGTTPVGCVVVDGDGQVAACGRGRRYTLDHVPGQLSNSHLAHAELNALAQLGPTRRHEDHTVFTTLEPCLLCMGAVVMATVGRLEYAGADPYGGAAHLTLHNAHTARMMPHVIGPADGATGTLGALLHYAFYVERDSTGVVTAAYREAMPGFVATVDDTGLTQEVLRCKSLEADLADVLALLR
jgi:tRNA(Arg) A34 adenosine deaminase TadA